MNAEQVHQMLASIVPFVNTVGLKITEVGPGSASATLECRKEVQNHIGSVHAGALYTVGESATGAVVIGLFGDLLPNVFIALKSAAVAHSKARPGDLMARATLVGDARECRAAYNSTGKADFDIAVEFSVEDTGVATIHYTWAVRAPR